MWPAEVFSIGITVVDFRLNLLNWFHFLILLKGPLVILIDCMIFQSPFLDVIRKYDKFLSSHSFTPSFLGSFQTAFPHGFNLFVLYLLTPCFLVADEPCMEWNPVKKYKEPQYCKYIILMGACHQLLARQKTIFKQYSKGYWKVINYVSLMLKELLLDL